jgi:hypothetical protein
MYKVAIDRAPWWTAPRNGLGLLYTQSGEEDDARGTLERRTRSTRSTRDDELPAPARRHGEVRSGRERAFRRVVRSEDRSVIPEYFGEYSKAIYADVL